MHDWATHYYPNVLEAMRHRWISPQFITTNRIDEPGNAFYAEVRELGRRVIEALGIETSATHMEWFYGPKGLKFSEIGARPPGVGAWDVYSAANEVDVYREWAHVITHRAPEQQMKRTYAAGIVALRPDHDGSVTGYTGIDEIQSRYGEWVIDGHFPPVGHGTQAVEAGYMANAWVRLRHPDFDTARAMLDDVGPHHPHARGLSTCRCRRRSCSARNGSRRPSGATVRSLELTGRIAMVNSGWEERESDDAELAGHLDGRGVNLRLHHRMIDVLAKDEHFAAAALAFRDRMDELRAFYGIRLQAAIDAVHAVAHRTSLHAVGPVAEEAAIEAVRDVDRWYAGRARRALPLDPRHRGARTRAARSAGTGARSARSSTSARPSSSPAATCAPCCGRCASST